MSKPLAMIFFVLDICHICGHKFNRTYVTETDLRACHECAKNGQEGKSRNAVIRWDAWKRKASKLNIRKREVVIKE